MHFIEKIDAIIIMIDDIFNEELEYDGLKYNEIFNIAQNCKKCNLYEERTKVVFGTGPVPCDLMLIGEGPGEQEDKTGLPFVGRAGQLLTKILESININRDKDIYIANIVKCRPPKNRAPYPTEIESCMAYLKAQINIVMPKILLLAGSPSAKTVLNNNETITKIRGKWFKKKVKYMEDMLYIMPIFHPSYLLRNQRRDVGSPKWQTWQDMIEIKNALDHYKKRDVIEG